MQEVMDTLPIIWKWVIAGCSMVVAVGGAAAVVAKLLQPREDMKKQLRDLKAAQESLKKHHDDDQRANDNRFQSDLSDIKRLDESNRQLCKCMLALMDHEITGNSIDKLKKSRDDLNMFLIDNK